MTLDRQEQPVSLRKAVVVSFSPVVVGEAISTLVITSSDPQQPAVYVRVEGDGIPFE